MPCSPTRAGSRGARSAAALSQGAPTLRSVDGPERGEPGPMPWGFSNPTRLRGRTRLGIPTRSSRLMRFGARVSGCRSRSRSRSRARARARDVAGAGRRAGAVALGVGGTVGLGRGEVAGSSCLVPVVVADGAQDVPAWAVVVTDRPGVRGSASSQMSCQVGVRAAALLAPGRRKAGRRRPAFGSKIETGCRRGCGARDISDSDPRGGCDGGVGDGFGGPSGDARGCRGEGEGVLGRVECGGWKGCGGDAVDAWLGQAAGAAPPKGAPAAAVQGCPGHRRGSLTTGVHKTSLVGQRLDVS